MKNIEFKLLALTLTLCAMSLASCNQNETPSKQKNFLLQTEYGVYDSNGSEIFGYSNNTCQFGYSSADLNSRIQKDDLSAYIYLAFKGEPKADAAITVDITASGVTGVGNKSGESVRVLKAQDNKLWVWRESTNMGFIVYWGE